MKRLRSADSREEACQQALASQKNTNLPTSCRWGAGNETSRMRFRSTSGIMLGPGISMVLVLWMACFLDFGSCFHASRKPTFSSGRSRIELCLVEPTELTQELQKTVFQDDATSGGNQQHGSILHSLVMNAGGDEDEADPGFVDENNEVAEGETEEDRIERLENAARAAALLSRRRSARPSGVGSGKNTSVGARRIGSASQARAGTRSLNRLTDAVKTAAVANAAKNSRKREDSNGPSLAIPKSVIQATVEGMMQTSMGLFGEAEHGPASAEEYDTRQLPAAGTVLMSAERSNKIWKAAERVSVRVASIHDDLDIANLRLSVFSDFSPDMRRAFCAKSCQVLATRRNRGATCIVATVPRYGSIMSSRPDIILGTAECSRHEFEGTTLGRRRLPNSILYITEVAVSPTARRKGLGQKLMKVSPGDIPTTSKATHDPCPYLTLVIFLLSYASQLTNSQRFAALRLYSCTWIQQIMGR